MADTKDKSLGAPEGQRLLTADASPERCSTKCTGAAATIRRWAAPAAILAAGALAGSAAVATLRQRQSGDATTIDNFRKPFRLYDTSFPGALLMPQSSAEHDGKEDMRPVSLSVGPDGSASVFVIGDWGATLPNHITFAAQGGDQQAQIQVANVIKNRAAWAKPQYVLNVGDNFYVEGLQHSCQDKPEVVQGAGVGAFSSGWQQIYGPVANLPWLSVLGNHDYGGWRFDKGWPQQIGYSFINYNWIMPARYFSKKMDHGDFVAEYFMIDSNAFDAKDAGVTPDHNLCSKHNYGGPQSCANNAGMPSVEGCKKWFWDTYAQQKAWLEQKVAASTADWKIVVTHFPCGYDAGYYKGLKAKGLDLLVTGHRHQQELWWPGTTSKYIQSFMGTNKWDATAPACVVTGGGGGIVSQKFSYADYGKDLLWYGFFHLTINKKWMNIELVGLDGKVSGNYTIFPHGSPQAPQPAPAGPPAVQGICESYCGDMNNPWAKVCSWGTDPWMSCATCAGCDKR